MSARAWPALVVGTVLACFAACRHLPAGAETVEVEGLAPEDPADPDGSYRRALADAQRRAIEAVAGVTILARTRVSGGRAEDSQLRSAAAGRIERYAVLSSRRRGGIRRVRLRATVRPGAPAAISLVGVRVRLSVEGSPREVGAAAAALRAALADSGAAFPGSGAARWVVSARAEAMPLGRLTPGGLLSYRARVYAEARRGADGELVAARSAEASGLGASAEGAAGRALERAGRLLGGALAEELAGLE